MATIYNYASRIAQQVYGWAYGYPDPLLIEGTPENLKKAIREKGKDVFQCTFKVNNTSYSAAEYCVKINDTTSMQKLIELGAKEEFDKPSSRPIVHFYIECLSERGDLVMLHLLLDHTDVNQEDAGYFHTALEHLLEIPLDPENEMHLNAIEVLFQRGARIHSVCGTTPFEVLKRSYNGRIWDGTTPMRSVVEEKTFLFRLANYLDLERNYHPESDSALTFEEFQFHSQNLNRDFTILPIWMDTSFVSFAISECVKDQELLVSLPEGKREEFTSIAKSFLRAQNYRQSQQAAQIFLNLEQYYFLFKKLCKQGTFKDCFSPGQLEMLTSVLKKANPAAATPQMVLELMQSLGLSEQAYTQTT